MSKSGWEAIPIESPSSIQSDSPSDFVRRYSETASSATSTSAGRAGRRKRANPGEGAGAGGDACHRAILVIRHGGRRGRGSGDHSGVRGAVARPAARPRDSCARHGRSAGR